MAGQEIQEYQPRELAASQQQPDAGGGHLIALALEKGADPSTISQLMDLQERYEANNARKAFVTAMSQFKQAAPAVIAKRDSVDFTSARGRTAYSYANLGSIVQEISALLGQYELSASWNTAQDGPHVTVTCNITHSAGHRESVTLTGPIDESGNKNAIQAIGSTVTYLQRYTLLAALGLATGEDDDGRQGMPKTNAAPIAQPQSRSATPPPPKQPTPRVDPDSETQATEGVIETVSDKPGKKKDGSDYTRYGVKMGADWYNTFDKTNGARAQGYKETGELVRITWKQDGQYRNLVAIAAADQPPEAAE